MTDIFREVEEDVRRERVEKLWKAYGNYLIAALVLLFAGMAIYWRGQRSISRAAALAEGLAL